MAPQSSGTELTWVSFLCSLPKGVDVLAAGSACSRVLMLVSGSLLTTATCSSLSSCGAGKHGFRERGSALVLAFPER